MITTKEDPGVMSLGLFALGAFLLVGAVAAVLGRDAGIDPDPMPFAVPDSLSADDTTGAVITGYLPAPIGESSGIARSRLDPNLWFTHNDGSDGRIFAIRENGALVATWDLDGVSLNDVEDIASGPCPADVGMACLYLADTGDNDRDRDDYTIYVVQEPSVSSLAAEVAEESPLELVAAQRFDYSGDSRDAEALTVFPDGSMLVITKGQEEGAELFQLPRMQRMLPGAPDVVRPAQSIGMLPIDVDARRNRVTGAAVSPSGETLAVRSDGGVTLFDAAGSTELGRCDVPLGGQGEAVDFVDERTVLLTFEASATGRAPIVRAHCLTASQALVQRQ